LGVLANEQTIAIDLPGKTLIPLRDNQNSIRRLIDLKNHNLVESHDFSAFGEELKASIHRENPWTYASKRLDPDLHLLNFGARLYNARTGRWLTPDPAGFHDSTNLYQYVFNNPFKYTDPDGKFIFAVPLLAFTWKLLAVACVTACVGYQIEQMQAHSHHSSAVNEFNAAVHQVVQSSTGLVGLLTRNPSISKKIEMYAPDRPLPRDPRTQEPVPEADVPHTELGTKNGTKGKYPQAREFDAQGRPVRDIDFTDHGRPQNHPNRHQHKWKPNPTGGTPQRSPEAEPLTK
jgi:RHS repeat-associated protein